MCSGGVTVTIIGADVDAAVEPILTLFSGNNSAGNGVRRIQIELHNCAFPKFILPSLFPIDLHSPVCHLPLLSGAFPTI